MAKNCVTEKTVQRQRWIENGLLELMRQKNYSPINVSDLCRHLNLSRRSFYRYFDDLNDVIDSLIDHTFQNLAVAPLRPGVEDLQRCFEFWLERRTVLEALFHGGYIEKLFLFTLQYTDFQVSDTSGDILIMDNEARIYVIGGFMSLVLSWQIEGFRKTPEEMARIGHRMLYEPFIKAK